MMKEKIFNKMIEYGWNLEDFDEVYNYHYNDIDYWYDYICERNYDFSMQSISKSKFESMIDFMSDFLRAINDLDKKEGEKQMDLRKDFNLVEKDLIDVKQQFNETIESILYDDVFSELTDKDIKRIINYRKGIAKCYMMIDKINEGE